MSPSTADDGCQKPFKSLKWTWEPVHVGFEPKFTMTSFGTQAATQVPGCQVIFNDDRSILSPSTAYDGCQTPFICLEWMWEPVHMGLVPKPMHNGFFWWPSSDEVIQLTYYQVWADKYDGNWIINCIHMKSIHTCSSSLFMSNLDVENILWLMSDSTMISWHHVDSTLAIVTV